MQEKILDVRGLPSPEPMFQALDAIEQLGNGEVIRLVIHREPHMLFAELVKQRIPWTIVAHGHPDWIILIGPAPEAKQLSG